MPTSADCAALDEILAAHRGRPGALIPVLQQTQGRLGYIPAWAIHRISRVLDVSRGTVFGVVTFYSFFSRTPRGRFLIRVCMGTACYVRGAQLVLDALKKELSVDVGQTTADRLFTVEVARCFGACGLAPVIMVNDDVHQWVKPSDVGRIVRRYRAQAGQEPSGGTGRSPGKDVA